MKKTYKVTLRNRRADNRKDFVEYFDSIGKAMVYAHKVNDRYNFLRAMGREEEALYWIDVEEDIEEM